MEIREPWHSRDAKHYTTDRLREEFLVADLFVPGKIKRVYSHVDRIIIIGVCPGEQQIPLDENLDTMKNLGTNFFLERRELGIINIGGKGKVTADGVEYLLNSGDGLYVGMNTREVLYKSEAMETPAKFYCLSAPAHKKYPNVHIDTDKTNKVNIGSEETANQRTIYQYLHPDVMESCQLSMGMTRLAQGSVWNTMPLHTHERRMEVYMYFDMPEDAVVFHFMGQPTETRHIVIRNEEAVISPSWSIHSGCGTRSYTFIWGMVGENKTFTDMDHIGMQEIR